MTGFAYRNGALCAEQVDLSAIAAAVGTPFYCYSTATLTERYRAYADAFAGQNVGFCFALKANSSQAVIRTLAQLGAGGDVVSAGEMARALAAGIPAGRIVFSGVGKTGDELRAALAAGIHQINVESIPELEALSAIAADMGKTADIALRVNPDVDAKTHAKISTGKKENKFGIDWDHAVEVYRRAASLPGLRPVSVAVHIGSQLTELEPFRAAYEKVAELVRTLRAEGIDISRLDLGGGVGIRYHNETPPAMTDYAAMVQAVTGNLGCAVTLEPGRSLVAEAGVLVTKTVYVKQGLHRRFLIVDAAMNDLIRPALYEAYHPILPLREPAEGAKLTAMDVVGPVCETGDTFALNRKLPADLAAGDMVAFGCAGAYGAVMASSYNSRPLVPEVLVRGDRWAVTRRRPTIEEMIRAETLPDWLEG